MSKKTPRFYFLLFFETAALCVSVLFSPASGYAQYIRDSVGSRNYLYDSITVNIQINKDSTFDVEEKQIFNYTGRYNKGWRSVPFKDISAISDIEVIDGETSQLLTYSSKTLEKTNPSSWGKYTYYRENGSQIIEWYYDLADTKHEWVLKYKVHGGVGFYKTHSEIYWNLFTDYDTPVLKTEAFVKLPENNFQKKDFSLQIYTTAPPASSSIIDNRNFYFSNGTVGPKQAVTIALGWPKGLIPQGAFWWDFFKIYFGHIFSALFIFLTFLVGFLYWYFKEKYHKGRGVIVPQYDPPKNLRPAMAEIISKEKITEKAWPATIIDLAVRGYVKIKEEKNIVGGVALLIISIVSVGILLVLFSLLFTGIGAKSFYVLASVIFLLSVLVRHFFRLIKRGNFKEIIANRDYIIEKEKEFFYDASLKDYEKKFLAVLLGGKGYFSTKELESFGSQRKKREIYEAMKKLKEDLYKETEMDTGAFEKKLSKEKGGKILLVIISAGLLFLFFYVGGAAQPQPFLLLLGSLVASALGLLVFIKTEARLSREGFVLKEEWLGFKLYLETAEKYRMQNLTPEIFEKYLPYAMIFGVEKKWGRAFESLNMTAPSWYAGSYVGARLSPSGVASGFSPSAFSSSFSSSFASAFSSSGASGGSGGGGGAGGGGGGGGGGAS